MESNSFRDAVRCVVRRPVYVLVLFLLYITFDIADILAAGATELGYAVMVVRFAGLLLAPFFIGGVVAGLDAFQRGDVHESAARFVARSLTFYLRLLGADLLLFVVVVVSVVLGTALLSAGGGATEGGAAMWVAVPVGAVALVWRVAVVADSKGIPRCFGRAVRVLFARRGVLIAALGWGGIQCLERYAEQVLPPDLYGGLAGVRSGVMACAAIVAYGFVLFEYRKARVTLFGETPERVGSVFGDGVSLDQRLSVACVRLACFAFIPILSVVSVVLGAIVLRRRRRFDGRAASALLLGLFFSIVYGVVLLGGRLPRSEGERGLGYTFLSRADARLAPCVARLERGEYVVALKTLREIEPDRDHWGWPFLCASAVARVGTGDSEDALADFGSAAENGADHPLFHYYRGEAYLEQNLFPEAEEHFRLAVLRNPDFEAARTRAALAGNAYEPSRIERGIAFVVILLFLFTMHEYGHAHAAWRAGDSTAKDAGRLTLNPLAHLDLFGSVLLPGLLLWRQSGIVFGWAKPVPVNPYNFRDPKRDHMVVSFAGPAVNLVVTMVAFLFLVGLALIVRVLFPGAAGLNVAGFGGAVSFAGVPGARNLAVVVTFLRQFLYTSLILGCFNLIPVPPLDGSWILSAMLPGKLSAYFERIRPYGFVIFLALVMTGSLNAVLSVPIGAVWGLLYVCLSVLGFG